MILLDGDYIINLGEKKKGEKKKKNACLLADYWVS